MAILECCEPVRRGEVASVLALRPTTLLPDERFPEMVICLAADRRWLISDRHGIRPLDPQTDVHLHGRRWRLREAGPSAASLRFHVSQDEEHVRLELLVAGRSVDFGERMHHQSLLLLARERRADERGGFAAAECGWRDVVALERMLGIDVMHFNTHVFRARRQVEPALRAHGGTADLVERRCGQVRFGPPDFEIASATGA
jgi:hypothetical protein